MYTLLKISYYKYSGGTEIHPFIIAGNIIYRLSPITKRNRKYRKLPRLYKPEIISIIEQQYFSNEFLRGSLSIGHWYIEKSRFLERLTVNSLTRNFIKDSLEKL